MLPEQSNEWDQDVDEDANDFGSHFITLHHKIWVYAVDAECTHITSYHASHAQNQAQLSRWCIGTGIVYIMYLK